MTGSLTSTLHSKILRLLLLHWILSSSSKRFTVIVTSFILCKRISSCMILSLDLSFVWRVLFERSFQQLKTLQLSIWSNSHESCRKRWCDFYEKSKIYMFISSRYQEFWRRDTEAIKRNSVWASDRMMSCD